MNARELENNMHRLGMERAARKLVLESKLATTEEVALMPTLEVCATLLERYEVVSCDDEDITLVKKEDMETYNNIVKHLSR